MSIEIQTDRKAARIKRGAPVRKTDSSALGAIHTSAQESPLGTAVPPRGPANFWGLPLSPRFRRTRPSDRMRSRGDRWVLRWLLANPPTPLPTGTT